MKRLDGARELLDGPLDTHDLAGNLRDLERVNRWLGGARLSWRAVSLVTTALPAGRSISLLDVGSGAADIPIALTERAGRSGLRLQVKATDIRTQIVDAATRKISAAHAPDVRLELAPPDRLAEPDESFDIVHSSLVLHHLELADARRMLAEMARVARRAVIVNDLDRRRRWLLAAWLLSRLATGNRYTRHDAPLSVRRAYRPAELVALAAGVGLRERARLRAFPGYRYALVLA